MTKQEEIRAGMLKIIQDYSIYGGRYNWKPSDVVRKIQALEDSLGVVIKGKILMTRGEEPIGFAVVPLIGEES